MFSMYFDTCISPLPSLVPRLLNAFIQDKTSLAFMIVFFCDPLNLIRVACMSMGKDLFIRDGQFTSGYITEENHTPPLPAIIIYK